MVFVSGLWHWAPKTLVNYVFHMLMRWFCWRVGIASRGRVTVRKITCMIRRLELSSLIPNLQGGEKRWRLSLITYGQWFNQLCLHNEISIKNTQIMVFWEFLSWWIYPCVRRVVHTDSKGTETPVHGILPDPTLCISSSESLFVSYVINCDSK